MPQNEPPDAPWAKNDLPDAPWVSAPQEKSGTGLLDAITPAQRREQAVQGLKRGVIGGLGFPGDVTVGIGKFFGLQDKDRALPTSEELTAAAQKYLGVEPPKGKSDKVVEFLSNPISYLGGGSLLSKILGAGGAGVGADIGERVGGTTGEVIGAVTGGMLPQSLPAKGKAVGMSLAIDTPANRQAAANYLEKRGVEVSAGQQTGRSAVRKSESQLGQAAFSGDVAGEQFGRQMRQYTAAALSEIGEKADLATPEVIDRAFKRIGGDFDRLQANTLLVDKQLKDEIALANQDYINTTSPGTRVEFAGNIADQVARLNTSIGVPGETYKALRTKINSLMRKTTDPAYKDVLQDYQAALDGAMERTLQKTNPQEVGKWAEARRQYRNLLTIEKAATRAGEAAAEGIITPQALRGAVVAQSKRAYARGKGDFHDLARAGNLLLTPPKSSGTAENLLIHGIPGLLAGAGGLAATGNLPGAAAAALGATAPGLTGRALHTHYVQDLLKGKRNLPSTAYGIRALINALGDQR